MNALNFVQDILGEKPYSKQKEILRALNRNRRVSVVGCNGSGKDWAAARAVLWWMETHSPSKAIITGPTARQVEDIIWAEMRLAYGQAADKLKGTMFRTARYEVGEENFALGFVSNSPFNLQGFHSPNLLVVVTEAHAVHDADFAAISRLNPSRLLLTGNPFTETGTFFESHHDQRDRYRTIQISAFDTPNIKEKRVVVPGMVTIQDIEDRKDEWGEESPLYIGGVLGQFPANLNLTVVSLAAAQAAAKADLKAEGPVIVSCDVARFGIDKTVIMKRQGHVARILDRVHGQDTMRTAGFLKKYCDENEVEWLVIDDAGVGGGVVDRLREQGFKRMTKIIAFNSANRANDTDHFDNAIAEAWWRMRLHFLDGELDIENDNALIGQVSSRKYMLKSNGRIALEPKEKMRKSPDEADALAMTYAAEGRPTFKLWT